MTHSAWWKEAVFYQIYPRSFVDSNGDGEGDLKGISDHLDYVQSLGVDAIWLSPFYSSPNKDGGYDVSNPRDVDPRHGTLDDAKILFDRAHELGLKVLVDIIPNHFSSDHVWFHEALTASKGSSERSRFHFYDGKDAKTPPNNWISLFGGPAWTQVADGQWYLHLFDSSQPDLNWSNDDIRKDFEKTIRFWINLGVDGFRIDVAHGLVKENILQDHFDPQGLSSALRLDVEMDDSVRNELLSTVPYFDRDGVHEIYREWRKIFDSYDREIMAVAEAWVHPPERSTLYVRPDELQQVFNFDLLVAPFDDDAIFTCIERTLKLIGGVGASPTWALSNHDSPRLVSRIGAVEARALALFIFGLPGSCYVYQGQELGLPDAELADSDRQDPAFIRTKGAQKGRDGARVPLPWSGVSTPFGFTQGRPWLPIPQEWGSFTVEHESRDSASSLALYREALDARKRLLHGVDTFDWSYTPDGSGLLGYRRGDVEVILNTSAIPQKIFRNGRTEISSDYEIVSIGEELILSAHSCVWIRFL
ncbi:MAG: glycoside hydrolase family 13 protein [Candidatus Nanopelagicaceae bacterium]|nr:glycoside hydrolase family 13 protein [Candidatus Nanopelagicaceae bacterium]